MEPNQILAQLLQQGQQGPQGQPDMLALLKSFIQPNSTAGALANQDPYIAYATSEQENGRQPMSRPEFLQQMGN